MFDFFSFYPSVSDFLCSVLCHFLCLFIPVCVILTFPSVSHLLLSFLNPFSCLYLLGFGVDLHLGDLGPFLPEVGVVQRNVRPVARWDETGLRWEKQKDSFSWRKPKLPAACVSPQTFPFHAKIIQVFSVPAVIFSTKDHLACRKVFFSRTSHIKSTCYSCFGFVNRFFYLSKRGSFPFSLDGDGLSSSLKYLIDVFLAELGALVFFVHQRSVCSFFQQILHLQLRKLLHLQPQTAAPDRINALF